MLEGGDCGFCEIFYRLKLSTTSVFFFVQMTAGETFALYSLICRSARIKVATYQIPEDHKLSSYNLQKGMSRSPKRQGIRSEWIKGLLQNSKLVQDVLLLLALFGTCAFIGDGVLTPSISGIPL